MQATLDASALKHLTKALTCLSKYSDDLAMHATREHLILTATNTSLSAYCRFKYGRQFFQRYSARDDPTLDEKPDDIRVSGQLLVKSLLSILKHRTVEKSVDRCELSITEGRDGPAQGGANDDQDSLESKLTVRLHCKHGVVKTHRLLLMNAPQLMVPTAPDTSSESRLSISARALKDLLDHFPIARGPKSDPQLIWSFSGDELILKGLESSLDTSVKGQLSTELSISSAEFEVYDVYEPPITIAFHLREFLATISFAESLLLPLDMRFTDPAAPLFLEVDGDLADTLFVLSTSQVHDADAPAARADSVQPRGRKRELDSAEPHSQPLPPQQQAAAAPQSARKKPMKVVARADRDSLAREFGAMPPPSLPHASNPFAPPPRASPFAPSPPPRTPSPPPRTPLFFPGSQLSQADAAAIRASGLGIERMDAAELAAMLEDEGEEVAVAPSQAAAAAERDAEMAGGQEEEEEEERDELDDDAVMRESSFGLYDDGETQFGPTQGDTSSKIFRPLFDD